MSWSALLALPVLVLAAGLVVLALRLRRRALAPVEPVPATRPSARRIFSYSDIAIWVRERHPTMTPREVDFLTDAIAFDAGAPEFGDDWAPWLKENHERCLAWATRLQMLGGGP